MKETLLEGKDMCKRFGAAPQGNLVLDHVSLSVYQGDFTVIMGPSGGGKSTLLHGLSGMDTLTEGEVFYQGRRISGLPEKEMAKLRATEFGFVFQQSCLVSNLTLFENVAVAGYVGRKSTPGEVREKARALLDQMQVGEAAYRLPARVSGGEGQRAAVARAVIHTPGLLFADEPTGALNRSNGQEVLDLFTHLHSRGQSIVMVTHDVRAALRGTRLLYLEDGRLLEECALPPYEAGQAQEREEQVQQWLSALRW